MSPKEVPRCLHYVVGLVRTKLTTRLERDEYEVLCMACGQRLAIKSADYKPWGLLLLNHDYIKEQTAAGKAH